MIREIIWYEMADAKAGEKFLDRYVFFHKSLKKTFTILTLVISFGGILKWKQFENYVTIAFLAIAVMQLVILVQNQFIRNDKEVENLIRLKILYNKYYRELERLWIEFESNEVNDKSAKDSYYLIQDKYQESIETLDSELHIKGWKLMAKKATLDANKYLDKFIYNVK